MQVIVTGCWLTLKEVALLLGSLARHAPLAADAAPEAAFFDAAQLGAMGERLMHFMGVIKHNGAVEKAQFGYIALLERHADLDTCSGSPLSDSGVGRPLPAYPCCHGAAPAIPCTLSG